MPSGLKLPPKGGALPTGLKLPNGEGARFFCSDDESTVDTHFRWMKEYGLDGVFLQRFFEKSRTSGSPLAGLMSIK